MLQRLLRQKRRIIFATLATLVAVHAQIGPGPLAAASGVFAAILASFVLIVLPKGRSWIECTSLALLLAAPVQLSLLGNAAAVAAIAAVLHIALYGRLSHRLPLRLRVETAREALVGHSVARVWTAVIPGEAHPDDYWSGDLIDFDQDPDDAETVYLTFRGPEGGTQEMTLTFIDKRGPTFCRYFVERETAAGVEEATITIGLTDPGDGTCQIDSRMVQENLPLGVALEHWFDDSFGDELDSLGATLAARRDWSIRGLKGREAAETRDLLPDWPAPVR